MLSEIKPAIMITLILTVITGLIYPIAITGISQVLFKDQANGSLLVVNGKVIGSSLIGQNFAAPNYFHPRPSAAGSGYDAANSGATNLGPLSDKLVNGIHKKLPDGKDDPGNFDGLKDLAKAYRAENALADTVLLPTDAITRSASGLDPHISPANAAFQIDRVAKARKLDRSAIEKIVAEHTEGRTFAFLGEPRVNVLELNLALDTQ